MSEDVIALRETMEKSAGADLGREMIGFAAERLMVLEFGVLTGAAPAPGQIGWAVHIVHAPHTTAASRCPPHFLGSQAKG